MELQGLYELHDRLIAVSVAGVGLAGEDFRLKRAVEQIRPLAESVPVIKKLYLQAERVVSPDCSDRAGCLLDTLALSKAILCTQAGYETEPEAGDLDLARRNYGPCRPYSEVKPLEKAMTEPGGGRLAPITEAMENRPEVFDDYRLQAAVITALSDKYSDIAEAAERFLAAGDRGILPLVKRGFKETTDHGRIHRLRVIEALAGGDENEFYLSLLAYSKKELREEVIRALRFEKSNINVLLDLTKTEKGGCLQMVQQVLGMMEGEAVEAYWETQMEKKPLESVNYLRISRSDGVSDRIAGLLKETLSENENLQMEMLSKDNKERVAWESRLKALVSAMPGKASPAMQEVYRSVSGKGFIHKKLQKRICGILVDSIILSGDERLSSLAHELAEKADKIWLGPALAADLVTQPAAMVYEQYCRKIPKDSIFGKEEKQRVRNSILAVLGRIHHIPPNEGEGECGCGYELVCSVEEAAGNEKVHRISRRLKERPDPRWFDLLMEEKVFGEETAVGSDCGGWSQVKSRDLVLFSMAMPEERVKMEPYFYKRAFFVKDNRKLCELLVQCGCKDFCGLAAEYVKKNPESGVSLWSVQQLLAVLPMTETEQQQEIQIIDRFLCGFPKNSTARKNWDSSDFRRKAVNRAMGMME